MKTRTSFLRRVPNPRLSSPDPIDAGCLPSFTPLQLAAGDPTDARNAKRGIALGVSDRKTWRYGRKRILDYMPVTISFANHSKSAGAGASLASTGTMTLSMYDCGSW